YRLENPAGPLFLPTIGIPQALTNASATTQINWDRLELDSGIGPGCMILAVQCTSKESDDDDDDEKRERVEVHVTINE
ncbi:MAG TPA: hypothetical protein DCL75_07015, partial [Ktedonobacter sp.]|nr:hypothetical protein [Ktedonobacter sp.]